MARTGCIGSPTSSRSSEDAPIGSQKSKLWRQPFLEHETDAQRDIAAWLKGRSGARILDAGCGNSRIFRELSPGCAVVSITVVPEEADYARSLGCDCRIVDKHSEALRLVGGDFDFIVDVNPFSFAPTRADAERLVTDYASMLSGKGALLTHSRTIRWRWLELEPWPGVGDHLPEKLCLQLLLARLTVEYKGPVMVCKRL